MTDLETLKDTFTKIGIPFGVGDCDFMYMPSHVRETWPMATIEMKMVGTNTELLFDMEGRLLTTMTDVWGDEHRYSYVVPNGKPLFV